jgi:hypothetical protein
MCSYGYKEVLHLIPIHTVLKYRGAYKQRNSSTTSGTLAFSRCCLQEISQLYLFLGVVVILCVCDVTVCLR